jgi:hypothetical protein
MQGGAGCGAEAHVPLQGPEEGRGQDLYHEHALQPGRDPPHCQPGGLLRQVAESPVRQYPCDMLVTRKSRHSILARRYFGSVSKNKLENELVTCLSRHFEKQSLLISRSDVSHSLPT